MTEEQAKAIYHQLFIAFPGYQTWIQKTDDPNETIAVWCKMLGNVPHGAGVTAADLMISGERKMPEAYERDQLPLCLKSYALRIAQDERKRRATESHRESRLRASDARTGNDKGFAMGLGVGYRKLLSLGSDFRNGKIDQEFYEERVAEINKLVMTRRSEAVG